MLQAPAQKVHRYLLWPYVTFVQGNTEESDLIIVGKRGQREISERILLGVCLGRCQECASYALFSL